MGDATSPAGPGGDRDPVTGLRPSLVSVDDLNAIVPGSLPGLLGFEVLDVSWGQVHARLAVRDELMAPNGFLHVATVIGLADTACGFGVRTCLPEGAEGFTTLGLDASFVGTARDGDIEVAATLLHGGRTTQVWQAEVRATGSDRRMAFFRCTQLILYPR